MPKHITVKRNGAAVKLLPYRTPRHTMDQQILFMKAYKLLPPMAEKFGDGGDGLIEREIDKQISRFCILSARAASATGLDFELADTSDTEASLSEKFDAYLDTAHDALLQEVETRIAQMDAPADPALAPTPPEDDDPK